ncbi:MAG: type II secretion system protein, partial [Brachyspira sp.]|nr:type II secretion system protein [Brachyspira sp.]
GFTVVSHPELVSGSKEAEVVETNKDRFRTKFGMTKTPRHPELVSGSKGTDVGEIVQNRFQLKEDRVTRLVPRLFPLSTKFGMTMSPLPLGEGGRSPGEGICISRKFGFTLAEVLITLGIIGVVAALTLPTLNQAVNKRVRAEQIRTVKYKFTKATDKMNSLGLIGPYSSTAAFVAELQKHLKIAKVCPSSKLRECWPYDKITLLDGKEYEVEKIQTGKQFQMKNSDTADYSSPNVGIITGDGTPMILSYNTKCEALDPVKQYGWSTEDNKPVSNATASCVAAVFEVNGTGKPNKQNDDVALFNANGLGSSCAIELDNGKCFSSPFSPKPLRQAECRAKKNELGIRTCPYSSDYWAGAVEKCGGVDKLPTLEDLAQIASLIYEGNPNISVAGTTYNLTYKPGTATSLGFPEPDFHLWSGVELDEWNEANVRSFYSTKTFNCPACGVRFYSYDMAVCLVD